MTDPRWLRADLKSRTSLELIDELSLPAEGGHSKLEPPQSDVPKSCSILNGGVGAYGGPPYNRNLSSEHPHSCVPTRGRHET